MDDSRGDGAFRPATQVLRQAPSANLGAQTIVGQSAGGIDVVISRPRRVAHLLHICRRCESQLVQASQWEEVAQERWQLRLDCPNCGWHRRGTFSSGQLAALEDQLDGGFDLLLADLKRLTAANMTDEIERFAGALESGLILPEDF